DHRSARSAKSAGEVVVVAGGRSADELRLDPKPGGSFRPPAIAPQPAEPPARPVSAKGPARFLFHGKPARRFDPVARKLASGAIRQRSWFGAYVAGPPSSRWHQRQRAANILPARASASREDLP